MKKVLSRKTAFRLAALLGMVLLLAACGGTNKDLSPPALTYSGTDASTTVRTHELSGTVEPGATVTVTVNTSATVSSPVVTGGTWSCKVSNLADGLNTVTVSAKDNTGNLNNLSIGLTYNALSIETYVTPIPGSSETIGGLLDTSAASNGAVPNVSVNGGTPLQATVSGDTWQATLSNLGQGDSTIEASLDFSSVSTALSGLGTVTKNVTINASNSSAPQITIDPVQSPTLAPDQKIGGSVTDGLTPTLTVVTSTGQTVTTVGSPDLSTAGKWSAQLTGLNPGENVVTAAVTADNGTTATARTLITYRPIETVPADGASGVDGTKAVTATFALAMDGSTIDSSSFTLTPLDASGTPGAAVTATVSYDANSQTATLTPSTALTAGTKYQVTLTTAITDANGNALSQDVTWSFTTAP